MNSAATIQRPPYLLPVLVLSQWAGTSLWFAGNAILPELQVQYGLPPSFMAWLTSAVQLGFITGTLVFAAAMLADRLKPSRLFFACALLAAASNLAVVYAAGNASLIVVSRFLTGFFLAGVYPVGMKIAADWYAGSLGKALGFLVGALVLGTALPHGLKSLSWQMPWQQVLYCTSGAAVAGGLLVWWLVGPGPLRVQAAVFKPTVAAHLFSITPFRRAAAGYFGHMWELYAFWAFIPLWVTAYNQSQGSRLPVSLLAFAVIAAGALGCVLGGLLARHSRSEHIAGFALLGSGLCCTLSPFIFAAGPLAFTASVLLWGLFAAADSPQFSSLVARYALPQYRGTALTLSTCIGFAITIGSIQLLNAAWHHLQLAPQYLMLLLAPGPLAGLWQFRKMWLAPENV